MVITLARELTYSWDKHPEVKVTYRVPTAEDVEKLLREKPGDCEVFSSFATKVDGLTDDAGKAYGIEDIVKLPGLWMLVTGVAKAVMEAATIGVDGKNA